MVGLKLQSVVDTIRSLIGLAPDVYAFLKWKDAKKDSSKS